MSGRRIGVLAMAYGTPRSTEEIEPYYTHIRRGRPPEPHQLTELVARYEAIGGLSPLNEITGQQVRGIQNALHQMDPSNTYLAYTGFKHAAPFIEDTVTEMVQDGIQEAIGVVLAPHYSSMSVGAYIKAASETALTLHEPSFSFVESWHLQPKFLQSTANRVQAALDQFEETDRASVPVVFTAHSLPARIESMGDPYPQQIEETAAAVAERIQHKRWYCGWQSAGRTPEPWLGPDILDILRNLHKQGTSKVVICPVGFVSDHLEVLYDVDIEAQAVAKQLGMKLVRTASPNDEPLFLEAVAAAILAKVPGRL